MDVPDAEIDKNILNRIQGSMIGMALGDALGAHVEFRPRQYLVANPVEDLESGGTWGLKKGQVNIFIFIYTSESSYNAWQTFSVLSFLQIIFDKTMINFDRLKFEHLFKYSESHH
jgi:hypothetical protein